MKRLVVTLAVTLVAVSSSAAIQYEFVQKNTTADTVEPVTDPHRRHRRRRSLARRFSLRKSLPPGTRRFDGRVTRCCSSTRWEWYTEVNTTSVGTALASSNIRITNLKSSIEMRDDRPVIAGYATEHTRLTITHDISVTMKSIRSSSTCGPKSTRGRRRSFEVSVMSFLSALRTGNPDRQVARRRDDAGEGFALRQTVTTRAVADLRRGGRRSRHRRRARWCARCG
jgi:hypothetical protein